MLTVVIYGNNDIYGAFAGIYSFQTTIGIFKLMENQREAVVNDETELELLGAVALTFRFP